MLQAISDKEVLADIKPNLASYLRVSQGNNYFFSRWMLVLHHVYGRRSGDNRYTVMFS